MQGQHIFWTHIIMDVLRSTGKIKYYMRDTVEQSDDTKDNVELGEDYMADKMDNCSDHIYNRCPDFQHNRKIYTLGFFRMAAF